VLGRARLLLLALAVAALAVPASALSLTHFTSPSGNIDCLGFTAPAPGVDCLVQRAAWPRVPPKPASCDLDWSATEVRIFNRHVRLGSCRGDIGPLCVGSGPPPCHVLPYGRSVTIGSIRCTSRRSGVTCRTRRGRGVGFEVAREGYRLFRPSG
jgi:uncharacterized protein DUF6636